MKYKLHDVDLEHGCVHDAWGISCDRFAELEDELVAVAKKLNKEGKKEKGNLADLFRESYKVAKNDNELLFVSFHVGKTMAEASTEIGMEKLMPMGGMGLMGLTKKKEEDLPN